MNPNRMSGLRIGVVIALMLTPTIAPAQGRKNWVHGDEIQWSDAGSAGRGAAIRMLLTRENGFIDDLVRAAYLLKVDPAGSYTPSTSSNEDLVFYVTSGQPHVVLGEQQIDAKVGDAFGVPAGTKLIINNNGKDPAEAIVFAAPSLGPNPNIKPVWGRAEEMQWQPAASHGPGCDLKLILSGGFSGTIRGLWIIRVNGFGINTVHTIGEHQFYYIAEAPEPLKGTRDARTAAARVISGTEVVQTRVGDAFYFAGPPAPVEHGIFNESKDKPLVYVGIGVRIPGQPAAGRGARSP